MFDEFDKKAEKRFKEFEESAQSYLKQLDKDIGLMDLDYHNKALERIERGREELRRQIERERQELLINKQKDLIRLETIVKQLHLKKVVLYMFDFEGAEFGEKFEQYGKVVTDYSTANSVLADIVGIVMTRRQETMEFLPPIVVFVGASCFEQLDNEDTREKLSRIARLGRSTRVHLIFRLEGLRLASEISGSFTDALDNEDIYPLINNDTSGIIIR